MNRLKRAWDILTKRQAIIPTGQGRIIGGAPVSWIGAEASNYVSEGYSANDVVYSITQITSEKIKVAPWNVYKIKDEGSLKLMQIEERKDARFRNSKKILDLRTKALELYTGDAKLNELLKWPNEEETFSDLVAHSSIAKMITGNRFIQAILLNGGANAGKPQELYMLPSQFMAIGSNRAHPVKVMSYLLQCGVPIPLTKEEVLHDKYVNLDYDINGAHLMGMSPLKAALRTLTNDNQSQRASTASFQNMGPGAFVYVDDTRIDPDTAEQQAAAVKKKLQEEYSGPDAIKKMVASGYKMGVAQMGISPVDLDILNQQKWNLQKFCAVWNFPAAMISGEQSTFNNLQESEKALTIRCALPLMTSFRNNFNRKLYDHWGYKDKGYFIDFDQTCYPEMGADQKELSAWLKESWHLPLKMRYELQGLEVPEYIDEAMLEKIFVPGGFTELSQVLDNTAALMNNMDGQNNQDSGQANTTEEN